jgi:hypothetical protein
MRFRNALSRFFRGRYGVDPLNKFLFLVYVAVYLILFIVELFIKHPILLIFHILLTIMTVILFARMLSRNIVKRQAENYKFLTMRKKVVGWFRLQKNKLRDIKTHVYRKCPDCKAVLRLKRRKGEHRAVCPCCGKSFDVYVLL